MPAAFLTSARLRTRPVPLRTTPAIPNAPRHMPPPSARAMALQLPIIPQVAAWIREFPGTLSLGQGIAGYPPPVEAQAEIRRLASEPLLHRYQAVAGLPELVDALRQTLSRRQGPSVADHRSLMITAGANAGFLQVIHAITDPGDEVLLPVPCFFNHEMAVAMSGARPVLVRSDSRLHPDPEAIAAAITPRTRAVVTVSPNNPTGAVFPEAVLREINDLCGRRGLYHISDETYDRFVYEGARHVSPATFPGASEYTITLSSFSKTYGFASWRVGWALFPAVLDEAMTKIQDTNLICPPVVSQLAALGCLRAGEAWVEDRVREMAATRQRVLAGLAGLEGRVTVVPAEGAFYAMLQVRTPLVSLELTRRLIAEHRVAVIPGSAFGLHGECFLRVAFGALDPGRVEEAIGRLVAGLSSLVG